jgi:hypothetical protein
MSKDFDAVSAVRKIRDDIYAETKDMSSAELIEYFSRRSAYARKQLERVETQRETGGKRPA